MREVAQGNEGCVLKDKLYSAAEGLAGERWLFLLALFSAFLARCLCVHTILLQVTYVVVTQRGISRAAVAMPASSTGVLLFL